MILWEDSNSTSKLKNSILSKQSNKRNNRKDNTAHRIHCVVVLMWTRTRSTKGYGVFPTLMTDWILTHRRQLLWVLSCSSSLEGRIYFPLWRNKRPLGAPQVLKSSRRVRTATCQHRWVWEANINRSNGSRVENTWLAWIDFRSVQSSDFV